MLTDVQLVHSSLPILLGTHAHFARRQLELRGEWTGRHARAEEGGNGEVAVGDEVVSRLVKRKIKFVF